ncbi:MAG: insulinase family protein [Phycisphaerae bacterium]|nr:insulinase family protein [Phycisphaerae bacterium]
MVSDNSPFVDVRLSNGLRIVMEVMPSARSAAAGFMVNTGSRDETPELAGVSHFLEHMCFKGTAKRDWHAVNVAFDEMGSSYNAFTAKERTFYYGWVPADRIDEQIELLADMMRSALPPAEFDMEKGVILEEIAMSKDSIEHLAWDLIHERMCPDHPLRWPVLGTQESIEALTRDQMHEYFRKRYSPANMVLIVVGRIDPDAIAAAAERYCGDWPNVDPEGPRTIPNWRGGTVVQQVERFTQQAVGLIFPAPASADPDAEVAMAVASALGGSNSRFYWNIIQAGLAPRAGVYWNGYVDSGLMMLDGLCLPDKAGAFADAMRREAETLERKGPTEEEVQRFKNKRRTGVAIESEAAYHRLMQIADDLCDFDRPRTVDERLEEIEGVTVERAKKYLSDWPITDGGLFLSLGPRNWPEI